MDIPTEHQLLERIAKSGDEGAFQAVYAAQTPSLLRFVQRSLGANRESAEDLVQETWLRAVTRLATFDQRARFATWLRAIALNVIREHWRSLARTEHEEYTDTWPDVARPVDDTIDLENGLGKLPRGQRLVLLLHDLEGYTHEEIGAMLGIAPGTSKSQLHDGRSRLRCLLTGGHP